MSITTKDKSSIITNFLNATISSIRNVVPIECQINKPQLLRHNLHLNYGVLIGVTGDMKGKLVFSGDLNTFAIIGQNMYGMPLQGEMLQSFSSELGNMIAGSISTFLSANETEIDITTPTILQGDLNLSGHNEALQLGFKFENIGEINTCLLIDR